MENETQLLKKMDGKDDASSSLKCLYCDKVFTLKDNLYRHIRKQHDTLNRSYEKELMSVIYVRKDL